jgi:hypothetical protein
MRANAIKRTVSERTGFAGLSIAWQPWVALVAITLILASAGGNIATAATDTSDAASVKSPPGFTERFAEVNGVRLRYLIGGQGSPVVLLHGYAQTSHM